jgi:SecD/SecF fusion protein
MKRSFFWRTVLCVTPVLLAAWISVSAIIKYQRGEAGGGFKLGVDLVGGTILVYEIDMRKQLQDKPGSYNAQRDTGLLAEALKKRIDPNDLYNIVIRPAGGEGRVEIILPTGGAHRVRKAEEDWDALVKKMEVDYKLAVPRAENKKVADTDFEYPPGSGKWYQIAQPIDASRGKVQELTDHIHQQLALKVWDQVLFNKEKDWEALLNKAGERWELLNEADKKKLLNELPKGKVQPLVDLLYRELRGETSEKEIDTWIKSQAWEQMIRRALVKYPQLEKRKQEFLTDRGPAIPPDNFDELVGRIQTQGNVIAQAALRTASPILGSDVLTPFNGKDEKFFIDRKEAEQFVEENYGPSRLAIEHKVEEAYQASGHSRDLTGEEVQRIKDLVANVGSLEFRILANGVDDSAAIADATALINNDNPEVQAKIRGAQDKGLPPPAPHQLGNGLEGELKRYTLNLPRSNKSEVTYSWVELGPQERYALGLDNAARLDPRRSDVWSVVDRQRGQALQIIPPNTVDHRPLLQGALFYSRECKDRNLPEEERRQKQYEYFVLTRNPEIDPTTGQETPKIDGSFLVSAVTDTQDYRPAVAFTFNTKGGELFGTLTGKNVPSGAGADESQVRRHLAIILDGLVVSAPTINSQIRERGQITGNFTKMEVDKLVNTLRSGALPASLKTQPVSESTLGATLGEDTITMGVRAIIISFVVILAFMLLYYRFAGMVACIALLANLVLTVGIMIFVQATFTLPGLAGLVLTLALAVDANVLIYERLREERERGATLALAIRNGYERAFPTIIDQHLTQIFVAVVLYIVGNDQLKGFGVSLTIGLIVSLFTSLFMTRVIFDFWLSRGWLHKLSMFKFFSKPDFNFMAIRYYWFTATIILTIAGMALFIGRLPDDLNIDFRGGTAYGGQLVRPVALVSRTVNSKEELGLRDLVGEKRQKELLTAHAKMIGNSGTQFELWYDAKADGSPASPDAVRTIDLANSVPGDTAEAKVANFVAMASTLPDPSVEQMFPSNDLEPDPNTSRYFTIRTTEKEPELVQAQLDRLLRTQEGTPLLKKIMMSWDETQLKTTQKDTHLSFTDPATQQKKQAPGAAKSGENVGATYASPSFVKTILMRELHKQFDAANQKDLPQVELVGEGKAEEGRFTSMKLSFGPLSPEQLQKVKEALRNTEREYRDRPQPERLENFDSQLAGETQLRAMYAIVASWLAILLYLWFRFGSWTFGLATVLCLIHDLFFTLGFIAACHFLHGTWLGNVLRLEDFKLDLTSVAALLTLIGYSVSDTIVVFDRIREVRGKNPELTPQMINDSVNQTLSRTLLTSIITWLVVAVLYWWGGPGVHLFAFVMVVGVIVGTYSSIYIASPLLLIFGEGSKARTGRPAPRLEPAAV